MESVLSTNLGMSMSILNSKTLPKTVEIYDTTLRDGAQLEGISLTVDDKLRIAEQLDNLGVHYIEGGWPGDNPKDVEFFERAQKELSLKHIAGIISNCYRYERLLKLVLPWKFPREYQSSRQCFKSIIIHEAKHSKGLVKPLR